MSQTGFYPHSANEIKEIETHISLVFLVDDVVYKIKKPVVFDFLDFSDLEKRRHFCNEEVRLNDVASDLAFLIMDLEHNGFFDAADTLLREFTIRFGDLQILSLIDFYRCYRACVRLKVTCFRLQQKSLEASLRQQLMERVLAFSAMASRYARRFARPTIYVVMGMIASGKSTLASTLGHVFDMAVLSSDHIRKEAFEGRKGHGSSEGYGRGIYKTEARMLVYGKMMLKAQEQLQNQLPVVLDATFDRENHRDQVQRLANDTGAYLVFIECECPVKEIQRRLENREGENTESDARLSILDEFWESYQPPLELPEHLLARVDSTQAVEEMVCDVFNASRDIYRH